MKIMKIQKEEENNMFKSRREKEIDNLERTVNRNKLKNTGEKMDIIVNTLVEKGIKIRFVNN